MSVDRIIKDLELLAEPSFAKWLGPFLNITNYPNEILLGIRTPKLRKLAKEYKDIELNVLKTLIKSNIHEARALAIFIMLIKVKK